MITLREYNPIAANQWYYPLNGDINPDNIAGKSGKRAYFQCSNNPKHIWEVKIYQRTNNGRNVDCPYCEGRKAFPGESDLFTVCPEAREMWDYEKNKIDPLHTLPGSSKRVNFRCRNGHSFIRIINNFIKAPRCKECHLMKNSIVAAMPDIVHWWDYEKNGKDKPQNHFKTDKKKAWWKCPKCGYGWKSEINSRYSSKNQCPCCDLGIAFKQGVNDLLTRCPDVKKDWCYEKNGDLRPEDIFLHHKDNIWWKCHICKYEWNASISSHLTIRNSKHYLKRCPACAGTVAHAGFNDITMTHPEIAIEYVPELNTVPVTSVRYGSKVKRVWRCRKCNQIYESEPNSRTRKNGAGGCPYCASKLPIQGKNDLATLFSTLLQEWDYELNIHYPESYLPGSEEEVNWICQDDVTHKWKATIKERTNGYKRCPFCNKIRQGYSLKETKPELIQFWDFKNNKYGPECYTEYSNKKVYWKCKEGHRFKHPIYQYSRNKFTCPICDNRIVIENVNDFASCYPDLVKEYDIVKNEIPPNQLNINSNNSAWWICPDKKHSYKMMVHRKIQKRIQDDPTCPICRNVKVLQGYNDLVTHYPRILEIWDYDNNHGKKPEEIPYTSNLVYCFKCNNGHHWNESLYTIKKYDCSCSICNNRRLLPGLNSFADKYPDMVYEWDPKNVYKPNKTLYTLKVSISWICKKCNMQHDADLDKKISGETECPYCSGRKAIPGKTSLKALYPELAEEYSDNNSNDPDEIVPTLSIPMEWDCKDCGETWNAPVRDRVNGEIECPYCSGRKAIPGKTSLKALYPELAEEYSDNNSNDPDEIVPTLSIYGMGL